MTLRRLFKLNAKRALKGSWSRAMALVLILFGVSLFFALLQLFVATAMNISPFDIMGDPMNFTDAFFDVSIKFQVIVAILVFLRFIVISPLKLGVNMWFYHLTGNDENDDVSIVFLCFLEGKLFIKSIFLYLSVTIKKLFCFFVSMLPGSAIIAYSLSFGKTAQGMKENFLASSTFVLGIVLLILLVVFAFIYCLKYFAVPYAFINEDFKGIKSSFKISAKAVKGRRGELFMFFLSMVVFYVMNGFILTRFYSFPYFNTAKALYARYILEKFEYENSINSQKNNVC